MTIQNIATAQNAVQGSSWQPPVGGNTSGGRPSNRGHLTKDIDGYEKVGTYGLEFLPIEGSEALRAQLNTSIARRGEGDAYPVRQIPELFGLTRESFEAAISHVTDLVLDRHGVTDAEGVTSINWQAPVMNGNANYVEQLHYAIPVGPNHQLIISGLFEPMIDMDPMRPSPDWMRNQYLMRIGRKHRSRNVTERIDTGLALELRNGAKLPFIILIDKQEAAPGMTLKPRKMAKMAQPGTFSLSNRVLAAAAASTETE